MDQQTIHSLVDWGPVARNNVQAVALSNFDEDGPAAELAEGAELNNVDWRSFYVNGNNQRTRGSKLRNRGESL